MVSSATSRWKPDRRSSRAGEELEPELEFERETETETAPAPSPLRGLLRAPFEGLWEAHAGLQGVRGLRGVMGARAARRVGMVVGGLRALGESWGVAGDLGSAAGGERKGSGGEQAAEAEREAEGEAAPMAAAASLADTDMVEADWLLLMERPPRLEKPPPGGRLSAHSDVVCCRCSGARACVLVLRLAFAVLLMLQQASVRQPLPMGPASGRRVMLLLLTTTTLTRRVPASL